MTATGMLTRVRSWYGDRLDRLRGIPALPAPTHEVLRGTHQGGSILVHGNGPSSVDGYRYARERFGDALVVVGTNASPKFITPDYCVLVDKRATLLHAAAIDPARTRLLITRRALSLAGAGLKRKDAPLYRHVSALCAHPGTVVVERSASRQAVLPTLPYLPDSSANAGVTAAFLALLMLLPRLAPDGTFDGEVRPGRLLLTGLDGYRLEPGAHHIDPRSPAPRQRIKANLLQAGFLAQVFQLAVYHGIEACNLSDPDILLVNRLCRVAEFDDRC